MRASVQSASARKPKCLARSRPTRRCALSRRRWSERGKLGSIAAAPWSRLNGHHPIVPAARVASPWRPPARWIRAQRVRLRSAPACKKPILPATTSTALSLLTRPPHTARSYNAAGESSAPSRLPPAQAAKRSPAPPDRSPRSSPAKLGLVPIPTARTSAPPPAPAKLPPGVSCPPDSTSTIAPRAPWPGRGGEEGDKRSLPRRHPPGVWFTSWPAQPGCPPALRFRLLRGHQGRHLMPGPW